MRSLDKLVAAALATVSMALVATPASAALMLASFRGVVVSGAGSIPTYDNGDFFRRGEDLIGSSFTAEFKYDTLRGVAVTNNLTDSRVGGPLANCGDCLSPILSASLTINGFTDYFNVNGAGYANVTIVPTQWRQTFFALGYYGDLGYSNALQLFVLNVPSDPPRLGVEYTGSDVGGLGAPDTVPFAKSFSDQRDYRLALSNRSVTLTAIPEPATWGLMIIGFAGAGAMLRGRRQVLARL